MKYVLRWKYNLYKHLRKRCALNEKAVWESFGFRCMIVKNKEADFLLLKSKQTLIS